MNSLFVTLCVLSADIKRRFAQEDRGATAVEYGLLVGLIAVVIVAAVTLLGTQLAGIFSSITTSL